LIAVQACQPQPAGAALAGTEWRLLTIGKTDVMPDTEITIRFADGEVSGNASCNSYFASYEANGSRLTFDAVGMTEMWCMEPEGLMDQETRYLQTLPKAESYNIADGKLIIFLSDGDQLIFEAL